MLHDKKGTTQVTWFKYAFAVLQGYPVINTNKTVVDYLIEGDSSSVGVSLRYSMITYVADADAAVRYYICTSLVFGFACVTND